MVRKGDYTMKLYMMSDADNVHTQRWVTALAARGVEIMLFSLSNKGIEFYDKLENVTCVSFAYNSLTKIKCGGNSLSKLKYLNTVSFIKKSIKKFAPDIVHAHYASSYGLLGALVGKHPYVISMWGSDVYYFPRISPLHRWVLKYNLSCADAVLSTSNVMATETKLYTDKEPFITPFGVDVDRFSPMQTTRSEDEVVIGTVKTLLPVYGIDVLINAFALVKKSLPQKKVKLIIAGDGNEKSSLESLCKELDVLGDVEFAGRIANEKVPEFISRMDVFVALSRRESFGVAAVEAMSCAVPVVVSDADGFCEVVKDGVTGFVVPRNDVASAAEKILLLLNDCKMAEEMGRQGRLHVVENYNWKSSVDTMMEVYNNLKK